MTDIEILRFRSVILQNIRKYLTENGFLEMDTPSLSPVLSPGQTRDVFKTAYNDPWTDEKKTIYLVPSHEYFLRKVIEATKTSVFQLSKCYVNGETADRLHSPEFTLLELYKTETSCKDTVSLVMTLITSLLPPSSENEPSAFFCQPHIILTIDEAFSKYAGFPLSECRSAKQLAAKARQLGITEFPDNPFDDWPPDELFSLMLSQCIEPSLPEDRCVFLTGWPDFLQEHWSLYAGGIEIARFHDAETDSSTCTQAELEIDRLIMLLAGKKSIESVIPFPFRLKTGYY